MPKRGLAMHTAMAEARLAISVITIRECRLISTIGERW
jgi:hypothetical protein